MARQVIRCKERSNVKKSNNVRKAERMATAFMRNVLRDDRRREARARQAVDHKVVDAICVENECRAKGDRSIRVWRREE